MTPCCICQRLCVPLADYDAPTCVHCDARIELITALAASPLQRRLQPAARTIAFSAQCGTRSGYYRHKRRGEAVDEACRIAERAYQAKRYQDSKGAA